MKKTNLVTLRDIAEKTGYTVNTVSRALHHREDIAEKTVQYICSVAESMGYIQDNIASSMRTGRTGTLAVILADITNPLFAVMVREIERYAAQYQYTVLILNTCEDKNQELRAIKTALGKKVDGILICPCPDCKDNLAFLKKTGRPYVLIGRKVKGHRSVIQNDVDAGYLAASYLIDHYHRRNIVFINAYPTISCAVERREGFLKALEERNIPLRPELSFEADTTSCDVETIFCTLEKKKITFDAIFAFSDLFAYEASQALARRGKRIPEDVAVAGVDNLHGRLTYMPKIDSVGADDRGMSEVAFESLLKIIREEPLPEGQEIELDVRLYPAGK